MCDGPQNSLLTLTKETLHGIYNVENKQRQRQQRTFFFEKEQIIEIEQEQTFLYKPQSIHSFIHSSKNMRSSASFALAMAFIVALKSDAFAPNRNFRPSSPFPTTTTSLQMSDYLSSLSKPNPHQKTALNNPATTNNMVPYNANKAAAAAAPPKKVTGPPGRETTSMMKERQDPYTLKDPTCGPTFVSKPLSREWGGVSPTEEVRLNPTGTTRTYANTPGSLPPANNNEALGQDMVWDNNGTLKRGTGGNPGGEVMTWR